MAYGKTLDVNDISNKICVNKQTVCKWLREGKLKGHYRIDDDRKSGYIVRQSDFQDFLNANPKYKARIALKDESKIYKMIMNEILLMDSRTMTTQILDDRSEEYIDGYRSACKELYDRFDKLYLEMV